MSGQPIKRTTSRSTDTARSLVTWSRFLSQCLAKRIAFDKFEQFAPLHNAKYPLDGILIAELFLKPQSRNKDFLDPRIPGYLQILVQLRYVDTPAILRALYKYSTSQTQARTESQGNKGILRWGSSYGHEEIFFYRLSKTVVQGTSITGPREALGIAWLMAKWMTLFTAASTAFAADVMGQLHTSQAQTEMESARAAFVMLLLNICENSVVLKSLAKPIAKDARASLSESLASFIPSIQLSSSQIAARLELFLTEKLAGFGPVDKKNEAENAEFDDLLESTMGLQNLVIPELTISNSRAGLYIYINAALVGRPLIDDVLMYNYMQNRYQGDNQTASIDLILASFDVLANAVFRHEGQKAAHLLRSYLINKVPLLLTSLVATSAVPFNAQYCIAEALGRIDTNAFPTLSAMFDDTQQSATNTFTDSVRQDFCFACCLHDLVPETSIETLIGEMTYQTLPSGGRYVKESLFQQCMADPERIQTLIKELDNMDGNVGAVCQALTEVLGQLCHNKETMSLKLLCSQMARNPLYLDVLLLFDKPATILRPLCELLDNWRYDEDQGEYQPVYEEFGSVLLLLLAFVHRYGISIADLGIRSSDSFVAKLLSKGHLHRPLEDLTDQENEHIGGWVRGLFDNDAGGLGDDLMSSCSPQEFYMLVPTLFHQIVLAFGSGKLSEDNLKSGVEYLVELFLLPSLVTAIMFLSDLLPLLGPPTQKATVRMLQLIVKPSSISAEASTMLSAVLNIVAKPLVRALRTYQRQDPQSQEVEPLLKALKENLAVSRRNGYADHTELEQWTSTPNGGLRAAIRHTIQSFVQWSLHPPAAVNIVPTSYSHRQFLAALKMMGASRMLQCILDEVRHQTEAGSGSVAYDVGCALICAPDVTNCPEDVASALLDPAGHAAAPTQQRRITLPEALKARAEDWKKIEKADGPEAAQTVVRMHRKVEAQLVVQTPAAVMPAVALAELDADAAAALGDAMAAAAVPGADALVLDTAMDLGGLGDAGDLGFGGSTANSAAEFGDLSADDFLGLDWGDMDTTA